MRWLARVRIGVARRPWITWLAAVAAASVVALAVHDAMAAVRQERDAWGRRTTVLVATNPISPGDAVDALVIRRDVPLALAPPGALTSVEPLDTARQHVGVGEILVDVDIGRVPGPLGVLPDEWLAVTIDGPANDSFVAGGAAVVLAAGAVVAPDAVVVQVLAEGVVVGVPPDVAAAVAEMAAQRLAVVALVG